MILNKGLNPDEVTVTLKEAKKSTILSKIIMIRTTNLITRISKMIIQTINNIKTIKGICS